MHYEFSTYILMGRRRKETLKFHEGFKVEICLMPSHSFNYTDKKSWLRNIQGNNNKVKTGQCHLPKHLITEDVRAEDRNFKPADPPGKYETA